MIDDVEVDAIRVAYAAIKGLSRTQWTRTLKYLETRMAEDDRGTHIHSHEPAAPTQYVVGGDLSETFETPEEVVRELGDGSKVLEVNGIAVVSQKFAVEIASDDDHILEWFDSRDRAEAYVREMGL